MKLEKIPLLLGVALFLALVIFYLIGSKNPLWSGLSTLVWIWVIGLGIIALGIFVAERFGKKWAPILIIGMSAGFTILADWGSIKLIPIVINGIEFIAPAGSLLFGVLYFGGDYLNELYGKKVARYNVYAGFLAKVSVALGLLFVVYLIPAPSDPLIMAKNNQFDSLFSLGPRLNIMSIIAIVIAGLADVETFSILRKATREKHFWLRAFVSTVVAVLVDNIVFTFGSFLFVLPVSVIWNMAWTTSAVHISIALWTLPYLYALRFLKRNGAVGTKEKLIIETTSEMYGENRITS